MTTRIFPKNLLTLFQILTTSLIFLFVHSIAFAQVNYMPSSKQSHSWYSGSFSGYAENVVVATHTVKIDGAHWLRIHFNDVQLGEVSFVTITSQYDGAVQRLTHQALQQSRNASAIFNGNEVEIRLYARYPDSSVEISIDQVEVGEPLIASESICGTDNRYAHQDAAVGRVDNGCTAWIINNGKLVTAGHCADNMSMVEFNVPISNPDRSLNHSAPEHQYTIDQGSKQFRDGGLGADWAVFNVYNNSQTDQSPIQRQGKSFNVTQNNPGSTIRISGFGVDDGSANQTAQSHTGPLVSVTSTRVQYAVDTMGGNSGSPIIDEATGNAVGVHTHGGCTSTGGSNSGTRATLGEFWNALGLTTTPTGVATIYQHCNYDGYAVGLNAGSYSFAQLNALGIADNDISSIRVQPGYRVTLYEHDGFGGTSVVKTSDDTCLVDDSFNDKLTSIVVEQVTGGWSTTIEAENYVAANGVQLEPCSEGGQNVGWLDPGDWMVWNINLPSSGSYRVEYRVAGLYGGVIQLEMAGGNPVYGQLNVPVTGGWQNWQTISHDVSLQAGQQQIAIYVPTSGYNINWIRFTKL